jgi:hypothetical protein
MKKIQEKSKIYNIHIKNTNSPSNQAIWMTKIKLWTEEGSNQSTRFLNAKEHTPPLKLGWITSSPSNQGKSNQASNSSKDANSPWSREHNVSSIELTPHKTSIGHSNNKACQNAYDLGTKGTRARIIINDHKQHPLVIHNKKNVDHHSNSSQNKVETSQLKVTSTLETNTMMEQTWVVTKALWHKEANKSSRTRSKYNLTNALHKRWKNQAAQEARYKIEQL